MTAPSTANTRRTWRALAAFLVVSFIILNTVNAIRKGGDFQGFLEAGRRILTGSPLYEGSGPGIGVTWPPFLGLFFAPFATLDALSPLAARLTWYTVGLLGMWLGLRLWARAYFAERFNGWTEVPPSALLVPLLCVVFPSQTNFEHQNLNPLLLWILGATAFALSRHRALIAGAALGAAVALKAFPALLIPYLVYRRRWKSVAAAIVTSVVLTLLPLLRYGMEAGAQLADWWRISGGAWPTRSNNQSLVAAVDRMITGFGNPHVTLSGNELTIAVSAAIACALVAVFIAAIRRAPSEAVVTRELAMVTVLAVLLSPIAWDHYWVLLLPAFLVAYEETNDLAWGRIVFWIAAVLTSALTPMTLGRSAFDAVRERSPQTIAAVLLFLLLAAISLRRRDDAGAMKPA